MSGCCWDWLSVPSSTKEDTSQQFLGGLTQEDKKFISRYLPSIGVFGSSHCPSATVIFSSNYIGLTEFLRTKEETEMNSAILPLKCSQFQHMFRWLSPQAGRCSLLTCSSVFDYWQFCPIRIADAGLSDSTRLVGLVPFPQVWLLWNSFTALLCIQKAICGYLEP